MIEPVFDVELPDDLAMVRASYLSQEPAPLRIVILDQVYDSPINQGNIKRVCDELIRAANVRLLLAEGADGEIDLFGRQGEQAGRGISKGQVEAVKARGREVAFVGIDDPSLAVRSGEAMVRLHSLESQRETLFDAVRGLLAEGRRRVYSEPFINYRRSTLSFHRSARDGDKRLGLGDEIKALRDAAARHQVAFGDFRFVSTMLRSLATEAELSLEEVQREQIEFATRVKARALGWYTRIEPNRININVQAASPYLRFWLGQTGRSQEDFDRDLRLSGEEQVFLGCKQWLEHWLNPWDSERTNLNIYRWAERLMTLALWADIPYFDLMSFRRHIAYARDAAIMAGNLGLLDDMKDAAQAVARAAGPSAFALFELEDDLDVLYRALRTSLPSHEADPENVGEAQLREAIDRLCVLVESPLPEAAAAALEELAPSAQDASLYMGLSKERSTLMIRRIFEVMSERRQERAIVVVGGFHQHLMSWALEERREVSWSVLTPNVDLPDEHESFII